MDQEQGWPVHTERWQEKLGQMILSLRTWNKDLKEKTRKRHQCRRLLAHYATEFSKEGNKATAGALLLLLNTATFTFLYM
jgi:hypothetical protein